MICDIINRLDVNPGVQVESHSFACFSACVGGGLRRITHNKKQVSPTCCSMGSSTVRTTDVNYTHTLFGNPTVHVQSPTLMPLYGEKKNKIDFVFTSVRGRTQWEFLFNNTIHNITVVN